MTKDNQQKPFADLSSKLRTEDKVQSKLKGTLTEQDAFALFSDCMRYLARKESEALKKYLADRIKDDSIDIFKIPLSSYFTSDPFTGLQEARLLYDWATDQKDKTVIQDMIDLMPLAKERHKLTDYGRILLLIEKKIKNSNDCFTVLRAFLLQTWLDGTHYMDGCTELVMKATSVSPYFQPDQRYNDMMEVVLDMDRRGYKEDKVITANIRRMRHKLAEYLDVTDDELLDTMLKCCFYDSWVLANEQQAQISLKLHSYIHLLSQQGYYVTCMDNESLEITNADYNRLEGIIEEYLASIQCNHFLSKSSMYYALNGEEETFSITDYNKYFRTLNPEGILIACLIIYITRELRLTLKKYRRMLYYEDLLAFDEIESLEERNIALAKRLSELESELHSKDSQLSARNAQIKELQHINASLVSDPEKDNVINELNRQLSRTQRQLDSQREDMDYLMAQKQALEEQNQTLMAIKRGDEEPIDIDPTKRYLFAVTEDSMKPKLKAWFPNCVLSQDASVTQNNYNNIYMMVFLTVDMTHKEGQGLKNKAMSYNIPLVYCNSVSYRRICEAIAAQEKAMGLR